jgi:hypothetical protein
MFGADPKRYVDSGFDLTHSLIREFSLPDWENGRPIINETDREYMDTVMTDFLESSNAEDQRKGRGKTTYSPEYWNYLQRAMTDCALRMEALDGADSEPWVTRLSTFLKAWASGLNPWAMLNVSILLHQNGHPDPARLALSACDLFPRYWNSRSQTEIQQMTLSYVMVRVYVYGYQKQNLMDVGEPGFLRKLADDVKDVREEFS